MTEDNFHKNLKTSTNEVRKKWLDFFQQKGYHLLGPVSLVPQNDPSLL